MANPNKITIDIAHEDTELCTLSVGIKENTLKSLLESLQEAKEISNKYLTELVNKEKLDDEHPKCRKIDELANSDEDVDQSISKKLKEDTANSEEDSD